MKKYVLYQQAGRALVFDPAEIKEKVDTALDSVYLLDTEVAEAEKLLPPGLSPAEVEERLDEAGIDYRPAGDSIPYAPGAAYFCGEDGGVVDVERDCIPVPVYEYWDGSNWREIWLEEADLAEVEVEEPSESLDRWDGSNWCFGGRFAHAELFRIVSIDSEPAEGEYLLYCWTQWQGDVPRGYVISAEDAEKLREEDGEVYFHQLLAKLEG